MTLWSRMLAAASHDVPVAVWADDRFDSTTWGDVVEAGRRAAGALRRAGVVSRSLVGAVLTNAPATLGAVTGVWMAGAVPVSLPVPARGMTLDDYERQILDLCDRFGIGLVLLEGRMRPLVSERVTGRLQVLSLEELSGHRAVDLDFPGDDDLAFIQCSSGSTSQPKGCMLTTRVIESQLDVLADMTQSRRGRETIISWLPLSHDMGFFGCLLFAWVGGNRLVLSSPERFIHSPRTWMADAARYGGTLSAGPTSALHFATRAARAVPPPGRLQLTTCVIGAESVEWETVRSAIEVLGPYGLRPEAIRPAYGMAEATLVVSATRPDEAPHHVTVDATALADGDVVHVPAGAPSSTTIVSVGRACRGVEIRVQDPGRLSEIVVRSPSLSAGYCGDAARTRQRFVAGEFHTRDLGFFHEGELYVAGRTDDVFSVAGRKVYARELETAVGQLPEVRAGCCTLIDVPGSGRNRLVILAELRHPDADVGAVAERAAEAVRVRGGVDIDECLFLKKGTLPKTPTGKAQRFRCRQLLLGGQLAPIGRVSLVA